MNWPPATMATQHPDNASVPWWKEDNKAFICTQEEIGELLLLFKDFPIDEYMWDWEGKFVDEAVGDKIFAKANEMFRQRPLGVDLHLIFRIPAFDGQKIHRMARAFMNLLSLTDLAAEIKAPVPPVKEMFLPLTITADQLIKVRECFKQVAEFHRSVFHDDQDRHEKLLRAFQVIPLIEDIDSMFDIEEILQPYWQYLKTEKTDIAERGVRVFLARSDPALNSGLVPAVLAIKAALSKACEIGAGMGITVNPVIGTGSLPFRGSVNPKYTEDFLTQYAGVRTYSIQSAFRYDYPVEDVKKTLQLIKEEAPKREVDNVETAHIPKLREIAKTFEGLWKTSVETLSPLINQVAEYVPARRERLQHIGLFGYSRGVGKVKLPRAIGFTAALYSIGIPPEIISTGRGLRLARRNKWLPLIEKYYPALHFDLRHAGKYYNSENLEIAARNNGIFTEIKEDVKAVEDFLGEKLGPKKPRHIIHRNLSSNIYHRLQEKEIDAGILERDIVEAGIIRRSLG